MSVSFFPGPHGTVERFTAEEQLEFNYNERNAADILAAIGFVYPDDDMYGELPVDQFINRCRSRLRQGFGKRSGEIEWSVSKEPGKMTVYSGSRREGYIEEKLLALVKMAEEGKAKGATLVAWG